MVGRAVGAGGRSIIGGCRSPKCPLLSCARPPAPVLSCCCPQDGQTPLHWAAKHGHDSTVALLLDKGADINATDEVGCAVVLLWIRVGMDECIRMGGALFRGLRGGFDDGRMAGHAVRWAVGFVFGWERG